MVEEGVTTGEGLGESSDRNSPRAVEIRARELAAFLLGDMKPNELNIKIQGQMWPLIRYL